MKLILIRHGETNWNKKRILQGGLSDIELNEKGLKQAKKTAEFLSNKKIDLIFSSPMKRAIVTATQIANNHDLEINIDKDFLERKYGDLEGTDYNKLDENLNQVIKENLFEKKKIEKLGDFKERVGKKIFKILSENKNKTVVVVSHSSTTKMIIKILLNEEPKERNPDISTTPASITTLNLDDGTYKVKDIEIGYNKHLKFI